MREWRLQDLPRPEAKLCLEVERFCANNLGLLPGSRLLLAISGGADSVSLAVIFRIIAPRLDLHLTALHINHMLREAATADAAFSLRLCASLGIDCRVVELDTRQLATRLGCGLEEAGRTGRYAMLEKERKARQMDFILLAHQAGDLCEDILMRLARGTGWPALGGMREKDGKRHLLRPLFYQKAGRLKRFLRALRIDWREDESNASGEFLRNRIRNEVLPRIRQENPSLERTLGSLHKLASIDEAYWKEELHKALQKNPWIFERGIEMEAETLRLILPGTLLAQLHQAARLRLYHLAVAELRDKAQTAGQARAETLLKLDDGWTKKRCGARFQLPGKMQALIHCGGITFSAQRS